MLRFFLAYEYHPVLSYERREIVLDIFSYFDHKSFYTSQACGGKNV